MVRSLRTCRNGSLVPFEDFYKEVDHLLGGILNPTDSRRSTGFVPRVNVIETESAFEVTADLPGVNADDVTVELHEGQLTITGRRDVESADKNTTRHRIERTTGEFRRVIAIDAAIDDDKITAEYTDGVLKVTVAKSEKLRPKKIVVQSAATN